jgi:CRP-like cAMP-binding protein
MNNSSLLSKNEITYRPHIATGIITDRSPRSAPISLTLDGFEQFFVPHGSTLVTQGARIDCAFYILSGWVLEEEVSCEGEVAWADIILRGEVAGLNCVIAECDKRGSGEVTTAAISALTDVFAVRIPRHKIDVRNDDDRAFAKMMHETLRRQSAHLHDHLVALSAKNANDRVLMMLKSLQLRARAAFGGLSDDRLPISQVILARIANISVVHMNRIAQKLRQEGILDWSNEGVRLLCDV